MKIGISKRCVAQKHETAHHPSRVPHCARTLSSTASLRARTMSEGEAERHTIPAVSVSQRHDLASTPFQIEVNGQSIALCDGYPSDDRIRWEVDQHVARASSMQD